MRPTAERLERLRERRSKVQQDFETAAGMAAAREIRVGWWRDADGTPRRAIVLGWFAFGDGASFGEVKPRWP